MEKKEGCGGIGRGIALNVEIVFETNGRTGWPKGNSKMMNFRESDQFCKEAAARAEGRVTENTPLTRKSKEDSDEGKDVPQSKDSSDGKRNGRAAP